MKIKIKYKKLIMLIVFNLFFFCSLNLYSKNIGSYSGYELPRFVSLKSNNTNVRVGPSTNFPIKLNYNKENYVVEIISEYKNWRKINDIYENKGWIHKNLLKGDRFAIIKPININNNYVKIYSNPYKKFIGKIGSLNIVKINTCLVDWCNISYNEYKGWIIKKNIWGVYGNETINIPFYQFFVNIFWKIKFNNLF